MSICTACMHAHLHGSIIYPYGLYGIPWVSTHLRPTGGPSSAHIGDLNEQAMLILFWIESFGKGRRSSNINCTKTCWFRCITTSIDYWEDTAGSWLLFWLVRISSISGAECSFRYLNNLESLWFCLNWSRLRWSTKQRVCSKRAFWSSWSRHWPGTAGHVPTVCVLSPPVTLPASMKSSRPLGHQNKSSWRCSLMSFIDISTENELSKCFRMRTCFCESEGNVTFEWK